MHEPTDVSNRTQFQTFDRKAWLRTWYEERLQYPVGLIPRAPQPAEPGEWVYVVATAAKPYPNASASTRWALCLISEELTERTATRLITALTLIKTLHGLDAQEGLAFLTQPYLFFVEQYRASQGKQSLLFAARWRPYGTSFKHFWRRLPGIIKHPIWTLLELLKYWDYYGGRIKPQVTIGSNHATRKIQHLTVPLTWVSPNKHENHDSNQDESKKTTILVEPILQPTVDQHPNAIRACIEPANPLPSEPTTSSDTIRCEGDVWAITYQGNTIRLKSTRGLEYLAHLLPHPGQEFHVLQLVQLTRGSQQPTTKNVYTDARFLVTTGGMHISDLGDVGTVLDPRAVQEYKQSRTDLLEELEEAQQFNDIGRVEKLQTDIETIEKQLTAAFGLGGKRRTVSSTTESMRQSVQKAIARAIMKISIHNDALGQHLSISIQTGLLCSYNPDPNLPISWILL